MLTRTKTIYKEKMKAFHDKMISRKVITAGQNVLLYQSRFKLIYGKLSSHWVRPFVVLTCLIMVLQKLKVNKQERSSKLMVTGSNLVMKVSMLQTRKWKLLKPRHTATNETK